MKKLATAIATIALIGTPALAADLARKMPVKAPPPPPAPIYSWTGFYVGANIGASWTKADVATTNVGGVNGGIFGLLSNIGKVNAAGTGSLDHNAFLIGGAQIGYNWQVSPTWLVGVEADFDSFSQSKTLNGVAATSIGNLAVANTLSTKWLATFRGRLGFTFNDWLLYGTGGAALIEQKLTNTEGGTLVNAGVTAGTSSTDSIKESWIVGVGAEKSFGQWSIKGEYLVARFDGLSTTTTVGSNIVANTQLVTATTNHLNVSIVRVGLNYQFH